MNNSERPELEYVWEHEDTSKNKLGPRVAIRKLEFVNNAYYFQVSKSLCLQRKFFFGIFKRDFDNFTFCQV